MKPIKIKSFSNPLVYKGERFVCCPTMDAVKTAKEKEAQGYSTLLAEVKLHPNLVGRSDLHGRPYKPTQFLFVSEVKIIKT
jgi:hypothetical protein